MQSARAKEFAEALKSAANIPVDADADSFDMRLPIYVDHDRIRRAQRVFKAHFFSCFYAMYLGLMAILAIDSILKILVYTRRSSTDMTAYKRYMQTIYHTLAWFRNDLKPGTRAWESLKAVRTMHFHANRIASCARVGIISQKDVAITQFGFMGFSVLTQIQTGFYCSKEEMEDYIHFWRVLGHLIGIKDEYNLCCETLEETYERLEVVRSQFLRPALTNPPEKFADMARYVANGMWCFNPRDKYNVIIFTIKRMIGLEGFAYNQNDKVKNIGENNEILKLGYYDRFFNWITVFVHEYLLQFAIFRWFFNNQTLFHEFLITYFPFLAIYSFGWGNAYVEILSKKEF